MANLRDPDLPPGEIVEKRDDEVWVRNDGVKLQPASKNIYYVMATIEREQGEGFDGELAAQNRRFWNGWACAGMEPELRADLAEKLGLPPEDLDPLTPEEEAQVQAAFKARLGSEHALPDASEIDLSEMYFSNTVVLEKYIFAGDARFGSAHFAGDVGFGSAHFAGPAGFMDGVFEGTTSFQGVTFETRVPDFFQRSFHDNTKFTTKKERWPPVDPERAQNDKDAYRRLRQVSAEQQNPENEHFFLRQEMACSAADPEKDWISRWVVRAFGWVSDYGFSLWRPIGGLCVAVVVGWLLIHCYFAWFYVMQEVPPGMEDVPRLTRIPEVFDALGIAVANTFSIFGFRTFYLGDDYMPHLPLVVKLVGGLQTVLGFVFLFFLGLGLRNRFRLR